VPAAPLTRTPIARRADPAKAGVLPNSPRADGAFQAALSTVNNDPAHVDDATMRSRQRHEQWLATIPCPILRLEGTGTVEEHVHAVIQQLGRC
jgi:hypothetical protein